MALKYENMYSKGKSEQGRDMIQVTCSKMKHNKHTQRGGKKQESSNNDTSEILSHNN